MRVVLDQVAILERSRLVLAGVADKISLLLPVVHHLFPFQSRGESGSAPATQTRPLQLIDHPVGIGVPDHLLPRLIPAALDVAVNIPRLTIEWSQ